MEVVTLTRSDLSKEQLKWLQYFDAMTVQTRQDIDAWIAAIAKQDIEEREQLRAKAEMSAKRLSLVKVVRHG